MSGVRTGAIQGIAYAYDSLDNPFIAIILVPELFTSQVKFRISIAKKRFTALWRERWFCVAVATNGIRCGGLPRAQVTFSCAAKRKVTKEKAARGLAASRFPVLLVI